MRKTRSKWDDVYAIKDGIVVHSFFSGAYGNTVLVRDADGVTARYAHLDSVNPSVTLGARVTEGQVIGVMGATGNGVPKPNKHLHISVYPAGTTEFRAANATINPETYISGGTYPANTYISTPFHFRITPPGGAAYLHEGTDMSGRQENLVPGWQQGITGVPSRNGAGGGAVSGNVPPAGARIAQSDRNAQVGDYWLNPSNNQWMVLTGSGWQNI